MKIFATTSRSLNGRRRAGHSFLKELHQGNGAFTLDNIGSFTLAMLSTISHLIYLPWPIETILPVLRHPRCTMVVAIVGVFMRDIAFNIANVNTA